MTKVTTPRDYLREPRRAYEKEADDEMRRLTDIDCSQDEKLTQEQFAIDADINTIAKRFGLDRGPMPRIIPDPRFYGDFSQAPDLRTVIEVTRAAEEEFLMLPPNIRRRFDNNPAKFWDFVHDGDNYDEGVKLGIFAKKETPQEPEPMKVRIVDSTPVETKGSVKPTPPKSDT